jgi:tagaturonate reductase
VHLLMSIALNSVSKFVARDLPIIKDYQHKFNQAPAALSFALAALLVFYSGKRDDETIALNDNSDILNFYQQVWNSNELTIAQTVQQLLQNSLLWGEDLSLNTQLMDAVSAQVEIIINHGLLVAVKELLN